MSELVNELLLFSQEGVNPKSIELKQVNLLGIIDQIVEREGDAISQIKISVDKDLPVIANSQRLSLALGNLVRNAVQYAGKAGPITLSAKQKNNSIIINVTDNGPGLSEDCLPRIFDPFYRPELSRGRDTGGVGLGLAIVKTCVEACNGTVSCRNLKPTGLEFTIHLDAKL
jgi:two-component system sensor histidine kinase CpxA